MNIFTLLIIMAAISLFNRLLEGPKKENRETTNERLNRGQRRTPTSPQSYQHGQDQSDVEEQQLSIADQREKQMEQLAGRMNTSLDMEEDLEELDEHKSAFSYIHQVSDQSEHSKKQIQMKKRIHGKLNRDGLVDSIIMAEVLGRPRALKPYQSILSRHNK